MQIREVQCGNTVTLADKKNHYYQYQLVPLEEVNIEENKIPISSPLAKSLLGLGKGEIVTVQLPSGVKTMKIISIRS